MRGFRFRHGHGTQAQSLYAMFATFQSSVRLTSSSFSPNLASIALTDRPRRTAWLETSQREARLGDWIDVCRDIFTVRLTPGKESAEAQVSTETSAPYICPVTDLSCLRYPFAALPECGHAFSNRAINQVCSSASKCFYGLQYEAMH